jgi:succinoglycan biosynthesis transport protein ExoP
VEIRDYLRMLRRGWPAIVLFTVLGVGLASAYVAFAPKRYEANAVLYVSAAAPVTTVDLQVGIQFAVNAAPSYADIIQSPEVLGPVAEQLTSSRSLSDLESMVQANARESTAIIDVTASAPTAREAANIANAVATTAKSVIPSITPARSGSARQTIQLATVRNAPEPEAPVSPNTKRVLAIGLIVGAALGLGLTIAQQALDTRLRRPEDLQQVAKVRLVGVIPRPRRAERTHVVVRDDPASSAVESYRSLRTNLAYLESEPRCSLLLTDVGPREDAKVPVNIAWSIAQAGRRVLLVDLDLRQSAISDLLQLRAGTGMSDVLAGETDLRSIVQTTTQPGLSVAVAGATQLSPSDLLSTPVMDRVLREAEADYDFVILHAPPLLSYTDAAVVSRVAGQTLLTVRAGGARALDLTTALGALQNVRVEPLGLILVGARAHMGDLSKVRGIWSRPRAVSRPQWDVPEIGDRPTAREQS